jgi:hypothetical protein
LSHFSAKKSFIKRSELGADFPARIVHDISTAPVSQSVPLADFENFLTARPSARICARLVRSRLSQTFKNFLTARPPACICVRLVRCRLSEALQILSRHSRSVRIESICFEGYAGSTRGFSTDNV